MLDIEHIFNLTRLGKGHEYLSALINTSANGIYAPIGSPLVINKEDFDNKKMNAVEGLFPFPFKVGQQPGSCYIVEKAHLIIKDSACFINKDKIKVISEFKIDKLSTLLKYVKEAGSITFNISAAEFEKGTLVPNREKKTAVNVCEFLDTLYSMCGDYKYNSLFFCQYSKNFVSADVSNICYTVSFLDLHNCIPIFNRKRVDGVGIIFNMSLIKQTKASSSLASKACIALMLSNYKDNVFITDGIQINEIKPINYSLVGIIKNIVVANAGVKDKPKKEAKKEESTLKNNWLDEFGNATITVTSSNTDGGTYYYYT